MTNLALVNGGDPSMPATFNPNDPATWQRQEADNSALARDRAEAEALRYRDLEARARAFAETWERIARTHDAAHTQFAVRL